VRGLVPGLLSPHPIGERLPALYLDDDLVQRFTAGLDDVLAPVLSTLDSSDAYIDPRLAPLDFVAWLAEWVGVELDGTWPEARQRALVARAADLYAWRGTVRGLVELIEIYTGVRPEIEETGGVTWTASAPPAGTIPGAAPPMLLVRVRVPAGHPDPIEASRIERLVAEAKPAHVPHRVEVIAPDPGASPPSPAPTPPVAPSDVSSDAPPDASPDAPPTAPIGPTAARSVAPPPPPVPPPPPTSREA
jgi:phage tail-like protein